MAGSLFTPEVLTAFAAFAEHLNFTHAAEELHISQPALHVKVRKLSAALGRPLYRREGRRLWLTPQGEAVARFARQLDEQAVSFLAELQAGVATRPVVLAAGEGAFLYLLGDVVRRLRVEAGSLLRLRTCDRDQMLAAVRSGQAQVGVGVLDVLPEDLEAVPLATYPQVLLARADHPLARRRSVTLADLEGAELIVPPAGRPHRALLERALRSAGVSWSVAVQAEGWPLMLHFVSLGVGLAVVNGSVRPGRELVARPIEDLARVTYHAVHEPGALRNPRVVELLDAIRAAVP